MVKRHSRRMSKKHRTHRRRHHRMRGGDSSPASTGGDPMKPMMAQSLAQGEQFANMHANQHGGGNLDAGPYPTAVTQQALLPSNMANSARVASLDAAYNAIANLKDYGQAGGRRRMRRRPMGHKKGCKCVVCKSRKASRKGRKASRKNRKTRRMRGGAAYDSNPASVNASGMLLDGGQMSRALSGMNAEWKLAENPDSFAPGVAKNYGCT